MTLLSIYVCCHGYRAKEYCCLNLKVFDEVDIANELLFKLQIRLKKVVSEAAEFAKFISGRLMEIEP